MDRLLKNNPSRALALILGIVIIASLLRFVAVTIIPPGLYIDEVSIGNNAYAILTRGVDEYGTAHPLWFRAFGEYKLPVMIYLVSASMAALGKTELAVRLPAILSGIGSVIMLYAILSLLVERVKEKNWQLLPAIGAFLFAITPWHVHFSRGGFEATVALFFFLVSIYFFLRSLSHASWGFIYASLSFLALTMYTYNTYRITAVLLMLFFLGYGRVVLKKQMKQVILPLLFFLLLILPVIQFSLSPEGSARFSQTASFSTYSSRSVGEKVRLIPMDFLNNYLRYFSPDFLFAVGDQNGRHQAPGVGLLYRFELVLVVLGFFVLFKRQKDLFFSLSLYLLVIAPIAAALTIPSPHSLRSLLLSVPLTIIAAVGLLEVIAFLSKKKLLGVGVGILIVLVMVFEMGYDYHLYSSHYPKVNALDWGGGFKETIMKASSYQGYDHVAIDRNMGTIEPYIAFYNPKLKYEMVSTGWEKPATLGDKKVLLIRPDYREGKKPNSLGVVYLPDMNRTVFAEFFAL